jgi:hypothetical protein
MNKTTWYKKTWVKVVGAIFLFFYVSNLIKNKNGVESEETQVAQVVEEKKELPSLKMAEIKASRYLKESMKDPDSFEVINAETFFLREYKGDTTQYKYIQCALRYRAKNGFGGYAVEKQNVIMNANFQPLEIYEIK